MKKLLGIILAVGLVSGSSQVSAAVNTAALIAAGGRIASTAPKVIPALIKAIPAFPAKIKDQAEALLAGYEAAAATPAGPERDAKIQALSVNATNILVEINNILDNFLRMAKLIGPIVRVFDENAGSKTTEAIDLIANTMYLISKILVGQQRIVKEEIGMVAPPPPVVEVPEL